MQVNAPFGAWLGKKRGNTPLRTFAELVGVDAGTLSRTERHQTEVLVTTAIRICQGLDLSLGEFFLEWQGRVPTGFVQLTPEQWQGSLTGKDVRRWLERVLAGHRRNRDMLIAALNLIVLHSGLLTEPLPQLAQLFSLADIEKLLWGFSWLRFEVDPPLECEPIIAALGTIYRHGGLVVASEIGAHIRYLRRQRGLSLPQCSDAARLSPGMLANLESGMTGIRLKLEDLLALDDCLGAEGGLIALYWWEVSNRLAFEKEWESDLPPLAGYPPRVKHALVSLFIAVGRWLQRIYQDDTTWLAMVRHELGLAMLPGQKEACRGQG
jgi:transcriptional regulator with XRE-family HTH domain